MNKLIKKIMKDSNLYISGPKGFKVELYNSLDIAHFIFIDSILRSYRSETRARPHIIITEDCNNNIKQFKDLYNENELDIQIIKDIYNIKNYIKGNTCLVSINSMDKESCESVDIMRIADILNQHDIPLHVDITDTFSYDKFIPSMYNISSYSFKLDDGAVVCIKNSLITGYNIRFPINNVDKSILNSMYKTYNNKFSDYLSKKSDIIKRKKNIIDKLNNKVIWAHNDAELLTYRIGFKIKNSTDNFTYVNI